ncbi:MAG: protein kinase [Pyrinomonadaceae bacterium]|nr:protein kinase [Pyrinomonadaceae bacterium]
MLKEGEILRERYRVIGRLGQGGMGAVYEAHDNVFDTSVALKEVVLDLSSAADTKAQELAQAAFEREAKILAKVNHETIPHVKDYFIDDDSQFLIMELVDGDDLARLLKERKSPFPVETLLKWTDQLLDALDYLHSQQPPIIHRDIKPQNLKLTSRKKIKLLDFGIAKGTDTQAANTVTNQTFVAATLNYSPIEQMIRVLDPTFLAVITHKYGDQIEAILQQNADVRSDLFALGATIYHLATNEHPAEAIKRGVEIWDGNPDPLEDPRRLNSEIPDDFAEFLLKSMQISRDHRYGSAAEMRQALQGVMEVPTVQSITPTVEMNFDPPVGDKTVPMVPPPESSAVTPAKTIETAGSEIKSTEQKTEVLTEDTAKKLGLKSSGGSTDQTAPPPTMPPPAQKKKRSKLLWLIPVAGVLLFLFAGGVLGTLIVISQMSGSPVTNTNSATDSSTPEDDPTPESTIQTDLTIPDDSPEQTPEASPVPEETIKVSATRKPTPRATRKKTPVARPTRAVRKPTPRRTPRKTPRKTPKKNMDCIFTDSC